MENTLESFSSIAIDIVQRIRMGDVLTEDLISRLRLSFDAICNLYSKKESIKKSVVFDIFTLHENLEGAMNYYSGENKKFILSVSSEVDAFIERLLCE